MKLAWFTPFSRSSAIGAFSQAVTDILSEEHEVELWIPETSEPLDSSLPVRYFDVGGVTLDQLGGAEFAVYNIGNNLPFHQAIASVARTIPGIVILHDSVMHHFYLDQSRFGRGSIEPYTDAIRRWYGTDAADEAVRSLGPSPFVGYPPDELTARFPLLEEATLDAIAIVTHSAAQADRIKPIWAGPLTRLNLPCRGAELALVAASPRTSSSDRRMHLVSFGLVGGPKQIHLVVEALASTPVLRDRIRYTVAGAFDPTSPYINDLFRRVDDAGLRDTVEFLGHVSDSTLSDLCADADAFVNLRWPSTEGGSASLTQQLLTGRPVVVSRSGVFDEVPDDAAIKIDSQDASGVIRALERLVADPDAAHVVGCRGQRYARDFTADAYVRGFLAVADEARRWRPILADIDRVGNVLRDIGTSDGMPILSTVAAELGQIFGPEFERSPA